MVRDGFLDERLERFRPSGESQIDGLEDGPHPPEDEVVDSQKRGAEPEEAELGFLRHESAGEELQVGFRRFRIQYGKGSLDSGVADAAGYARLRYDAAQERLD